MTTLDPRGEAPPPVNLEPIRKKVARCSERPDCLPHSCRFNCAEVSALLVEIGRLEWRQLVLTRTWRNEDGSLVIDGQRYTPDPQIVVHPG